MKFSSLIVIAALLIGCTKDRDYTSANPISVVGNAVQVAAGSKFTEQIQVAAVGVAPGGERKLRMVGQMIATANTSGELIEKKVSWVVLDPDLIHTLGLFFPRMFLADLLME